jgi:hypothetical protein
MNKSLVATHGNCDTRYCPCSWVNSVDYCIVFLLVHVLNPRFVCVLIALSCRSSLLQDFEHHLQRQRPSHFCSVFHCHIFGPTFSRTAWFRVSQALQACQELGAGRFWRPPGRPVFRTPRFCNNQRALPSRAVPPASGRACARLASRLCSKN